MVDLRSLTEKDKTEYNKLVTHVMQSWEWGEFRKQLGLKLLRYGIYDQDKLIRVFQLTLHQLPFTKTFVGYLPKGPAPDKILSDALTQIANEYHCAFIKVEPNIQNTHLPFKIYPSFFPSPKPLFTKYNFILDLTKSETELLKSMHPKTRYNIRLAQKKGVIVEQRYDDEALQIYLDLHFSTTKRQGFTSHNFTYHKLVWQTLKSAGMARLLIAFYQNKPLTAWMLLNFKDTLYYPYGGSSLENREVMASNLVAWEAIKLGKKLNCREFDMWGALGPDANPKDPWQGFHRFKQGYGGKLVEYLGTYDLVLNQSLYACFHIIDKLTPLKIFLLKLLHR